jgi:hypothetical protein
MTMQFTADRRSGSRALVRALARDGARADRCAAGADRRNKNRPGWTQVAAAASDEALECDASPRA